ncbi:bacterial PH domain protein [Bacillus clarus]|uniref:Bacterial PH domain protein n=1 Tax=Bacillus clarus TaxID=2338372 RepID=A0A090Z5X8_9BACI|nr:bacterial PH domain protein [Bacillus clarus]
MQIYPFLEEKHSCFRICIEGGFVNSRIILSLVIAGATFYHYFVVTNKRLRIKSLDCYFKKVNAYNILIDDIQAVSQHEKEKNVHAFSIHLNTFSPL